MFDNGNKILKQIHNPFNHKFMRKTIAILLIISASIQAEAQFIKGKSINGSIGYGMSFPTEDVNVVNSGFYLQGEYVLDVYNWFDLRPYAGLILTNSDGTDLNQNPTPYKSTAKAFLIGGKVRFTAPIPWFSPYLEAGIGTSIGSFETLTPLTNINKNGLTLHFPFSIGVALGPKHNFEIAVKYYSQPSMKQVLGAAALGVSFPLNNN